MTQAPSDPETDGLKKKYQDLEERRAKIRGERRALAFSRTVRYAAVLLVIGVCALLAYKALHDRFRLERVRLELEAAAQKADLELQRRRLELEAARPRK